MNVGDPERALDAIAMSALPLGLLLGEPKWR
jgi:hypothetical protein